MFVLFCGLGFNGGGASEFEFGCGFAGVAFCYGVGLFGYWLLCFVYLVNA